MGYLYRKELACFVLFGVGRFTLYERRREVDLVS
jgi:hypothetical protein